MIVNDFSISFLRRLASNDAFNSSLGIETIFISATLVFPKTKANCVLFVTTERSQRKATEQKTTWKLSPKLCSSIWSGVVWKRKRETDKRYVLVNQYAIVRTSPDYLRCHTKLSNLWRYCLPKHLIFEFEVVQVLSTEDSLVEDLVDLLVDSPFAIGMRRHQFWLILTLLGLLYGWKNAFCAVATESSHITLLLVKDL